MASANALRLMPECLSESLVLLCEPEDLQLPRAGAVVRRTDSVLKPVSFQLPESAEPLAFLPGESDT